MTIILYCGLLLNGLLAGQDGTILSRFPPPQGATRVNAQDHSFAAFLRNAPLLPPGTAVSTFNGALKHRQDVHAAVLDISVGDRDLQQCADALIRLRAEFLFAEGRTAEIAFDLTNGFRAGFDRWTKGERIAVNGNKCSWVATGRPGVSHEDLLAYLRTVFMYAGTLSLSKELRPAGELPLAIGDVFIQGGSPGHAVIVVDLAQLPDGRSAFLLAQSYMPAQQIHVLKNLARPALGPWFIEGDGDRLHTPEWTFDWKDRKRW